MLETTTYDPRHIIDCVVPSQLRATLAPLLDVVNTWLVSDIHTVKLNRLVQHHVTGGNYTERGHSGEQIDREIALLIVLCHRTLSS